MGATEEQMQLLSDSGITHVSYVLILFSVAFLLFLFVNMLLHLYAVYAWGESSKGDAEAPLSNGHANGNVRAHRRVRDAEEFELEGLISDEEDEDKHVEGKLRSSPGS